MPLYDYKCSKCEHIEEVWISNWKNKPKERRCERMLQATEIFGGVECLGRMHPYYGNQVRGIHLSHSSMYGKFHPGFGCVVEDYAHKQRLLKAQNVIEAADPVGGSRNHYRTLPPKRPVEGVLFDDRPPERIVDDA